MAHRTENDKNAIDFFACASCVREHSNAFSLIERESEKINHACHTAFFLAEYANHFFDVEQYTGMI